MEMMGKVVRIIGFILTVVALVLWNFGTLDLPFVILFLLLGFVLIVFM
ncbi:MAG: hypothetical protein HY519_02875 [Candidatus Aenigmarchaeota archaeon]|nr:hypothetical protein [Candidatus Aenigmarchaeota archaeon]